MEVVGAAVIVAGLRQSPPYFPVLGDLRQFSPALGGLSQFPPVQPVYT